MKKFSWTDAISYGWNTTRSNLVFFIVLMLILGIVVVLPDKLVVLPTEPGALLKSSKFWVVTAISLLIQQLVLLSFIKINLEFTRNAKPEFSDLVDALSHYIPYLIGSIIYSIAVGIGFMLLVVPGVYIAIRYGFFSYFIIDRGEGVKDSFESSSFITRGAMKELFVLGLILLGVNAVGLILGYISIGVVTTILINKTVGAFISFAGLLITVPITMLAIAYVFRRLTAKRTRTAPRPS